MSMNRQEAEREAGPGSLWRRWDPHIHAPGTLLTDQFKGNWDEYLRQLEAATPPVEAIGVTDYFCIRTYREVKRQQEAGRLQGVKLLFPNVEMRLTVETEKKRAINIHLLFSPDDDAHESEIERILNDLTFEYKGKKFRCNIPELISLGRAHAGDLDDEAALKAGANQFKVAHTDLHRLFRTEEWVRKNCLVAVAGGLNDGTSGLQGDESYSATRQEIERLADIIFSGSPAQRAFWLGQHPKYSSEEIERTFGSLKPCLHGSDAHRVSKTAEPDEMRFCWIKGDPVFESLRQAVLEPEQRVWIGAAPPPYATPVTHIVAVTVANADWFRPQRIEINPGLVAVVGARGSGKTALADIVAVAANAQVDTVGESSFLTRAGSPVDHLGDAEVTLEWSDGSVSQPRKLRHFATVSGADLPDVRYLSQHFVERLCSAAGLAVELRAEMEQVVFSATDPIDRMGADSFDELRDIHLDPVRQSRKERFSQIQSISEATVRESVLHDRLAAMKSQHANQLRTLENDQKSLAALIPRGVKERAARLSAVEKALSACESKVEKLKRRQQAIEDLAHEVSLTRETREPVRFQSLGTKLKAAEIDPGDYPSFEMAFRGDVDMIIAQARRAIASEIGIATAGDKTRSTAAATVPLAEWSLAQLKAELETVKKAVGIDTTLQKEYEKRQTSIRAQEVSIGKLAEEIRDAEGAPERRKQLIEDRRNAYRKVFETFEEEEVVLNRLYAPLRAELAVESGTVAKLAFIVRRRIDLKGWLTRGEALIDLRKDTQFRGYGALESVATSVLLAPWKTGSAAEVAAAMDSFRTQYYRDLLSAMPSTIGANGRRQWEQQIASWLYDTSHITVEYAIEYDGVPIEKLSPGTRGIVLLLLYLAIDRQDSRPLIIDQPEENLDPNSVFRELVPHFREVRKRRQLIVVTHNANLVVNTDADQVIVASAAPIGGRALPDISYESGALENARIRRMVCNILEGGEEAFLKRELRYRLRWDAFLKRTGSLVSPG